jgi:Tfp pilus assembly protein PilZ
MNNQIKAFLQCSAVAACMSFTSLSHADIKSMNQFYNNPASAPKVTVAKATSTATLFMPCLKNGKSFPRTTNWMVIGSEVLLRTMMEIV